ncbi:MAG: site-2 protease family protein [Cyanothece sp. SIO2G6]|nr:site-2 protease family protein [Cyanothece sp. SIO2G6]
MKKGWRIGSLFGIPFFLDPSWFLILLLVTLVYGSEWSAYNVTGVMEWVLGFSMALLLFASVLMHELGHSLVALSQGIAVNSITLFLFGGIASIDRESKTPGQALQVAIAGPLVSLSLFLVLTIVRQLLSLNEPAAFVLERLASINLILAIFNMMPGLPLDGGQVLKALIWKGTGSRIQGIRWAARTGQLFGWMAIALGLFAYLVSFEPAFVWLAIIGWFGVRNAKTYGRIADVQQALLNLTAEDVSRRKFRVVDANLSLDAFVYQYLQDEGNDTTPYFAASDGRYRGKVTLDVLQQSERSQWSQLTLRDIALPLTMIPSVAESQPLPEVIHQLEQGDLTQITVLSPTDAVVGIIDRSYIVQRVAEDLDLALSPETLQLVRDTQQYPPGLPLLGIAKTVLNDQTDDRPKSLVVNNRRR